MLWICETSGVFLFCMSALFFPGDTSLPAAQETVPESLTPDHFFSHQTDPGFLTFKLQSLKRESLCPSE